MVELLASEHLFLKRLHNQRVFSQAIRFHMGQSTLQQWALKLNFWKFAISGLKLTFLPRHFQSHSLGRFSDSYWIDDIVCSGSEVNLGHCKNAGWPEKASNYCAWKERNRGTKWAKRLPKLVRITFFPLSFWYRRRGDCILQQYAGMGSSRWQILWHWRIKR